ncbi:HAD family hydrolase [Halosegnis marinus]|uniref:HAD family hydrolase n=1 Tax=Halosegnis marinus TaxID=3034023 RepID=A0ABD5ZKF6_9EURY|nr:HAD hydrolase-like protein [Halosegnis sp. DT85]
MGGRAVVYDLDDTLVRLSVAWDAVTDECVAALERRGVDREYGDLWDAYRTARETGHLPLVDGIIARHERAGARTSERLPCADLLARDAPAAVCSLNSVGACHIALGVHGLRDHAPVVVGRDSVEAEKPDPEPLLAAIDRLGVEREDAVFVGDGARDERTAERAGVEFAYVEEWLDRVG